MEAFAIVLLEANRKFNLTGAQEPQEVAALIADALAIAGRVSDPYVDVGSGGGLPAIPLAIVCGIPATLIEASRKKAEFLELVLADLAIAGRVVHGRAEDAGHDPGLRESFASATAQAVAGPTTVAELLVPLLRAGGEALLQRGPLGPSERRAVEDAAEMLGGRLTSVEDLSAKRTLLRIQKVGPTPTRFPRRSGVPAKRPLCSNVSRET